MIKRFPLVLILLALAAAACLCTSNGNPPSPTSPGSGQTSNAIGTVNRERDKVEHGRSPSALKQLSGSDQLFNGDALRVTGGGKGVLDFGNNLTLWLLNDSQLGGVTAASAPGIPLNARMTLEKGGFTGRLTQPGGKARFDTPGGAAITVFGTDFFLTFNAASGRTVAGNFDGSMEVSAAGVTVPLPPGSYVNISAGKPPGQPQQPIPFSFGEFEELSDEFGSPVAVVDEVIPEEFPPEPEVDQAPPEISLLGIDPDVILLPGECPDATGTARITVQVLDQSPIEEVVADWQSEAESGFVVMEPIDDQTFVTEIGPVSSPGEVAIIISARDAFGNVGELGPIFIKVEFCIG